MMDSPKSVSEIRETTEQLLDESDRSLKVRPGEKLRSYIPALDARAGKLLGFNSEGDPIAISLSSGGSQADIDMIKELEGQAVAARAALSVPTVDAAAAQDNVDALEYSVNLFEDLRTLKPRFEGERVFLRAHTAPALSVLQPAGTGWFIGHNTSQADDGGFVASNGGNWHWVREKPIAALDIGDFGGVADGITDTQPAFKRLADFLFSNYARLRTGGTQNGSTVSGGYSPYLAIRYGSGTYYQSPGEYVAYGTKVASGAADAPFNPSGWYAAAGLRVEGVAAGSGRLIATRIISDKTDAPVFLINHRRIAFKNILWDGQQTTQVDQYNATSNPTGTNLLIGATQGVFNETASNKQPFVTNQCPGGCYAYIANVQANNTGSHTFYLLDTLDSIVEQVYSSKTAGPVIQTGWSGQTAGVWDHSTSLEIRNCNFGTPVAPAIWAPRCGQSIMRNCWFEHGNCPFDINNGQWDLSMICVEDCRKNPSIYNSKVSCITLSVPTGNDLNIAAPGTADWPSYLTNPDGSAITSWANGYDQGRWLLQNYGAYFDCPVVSQWDRGIIRGTNNTDATLWVNVGSFRNPTNGGSWRIRVVGGSYYNTSASQNMLSDRLEGQAVISLGRGTGSTPKASYFNEGGGPLAAAPQYQSQQFNDIIPALWVPIRGRCGEYTIYVEGTGLTRREAGIPAQFTPNGTTQTAAPGLNVIAGRFSFNTGKAGFGANEDVVEITSRKATVSAQPVDTTAPVQYMRVSVNGQELALQLFAYIPQVTTPLPATTAVALGNTLALSPVVTDAVSYQWQKSADGTTWTSINGATSMSFTKASVTANDAGQYRLAYRQNNGAGGNGTTLFSTPTAVSIT